jgi:predicted DNA-binding transcriptional regulator AlpA
MGNLLAATSVDRAPDGALDLLDSGDVAALLKVSVHCILKWVRKGLLPQPIKLGQSTRWRRADLLRWINSGCPRVPVGSGDRAA